MEDIRIKLLTSEWQSLVGPPGADGADAVLPSAVFASIYRATDFTLVNGAAASAISLSNEVLDSGSIWAIGSPTRLTVPEAGMYIIHVQLAYTAAGNGSLSVMFYKNGVEQFRDQPGVLTGTAYHTVSAMMDCSASDYIEIFLAWASGGTDLTIVGGAAKTLVQLNLSLASSATLSGGGTTWLPMLEHGVVGATKTIDWSAGHKQFIILDEDCTLTFTNPSGGHSYTLLVAQDTAGGNLLIWPASIRWPWGARPDETLVGLRVDLYTFIWVPSLSVYLASYNSNYQVS